MKELALDDTLPDPCMIECMFDEHCGLSVWDGQRCKMYSLFYDIDDMETAAEGVLVCRKD